MLPVPPDPRPDDRTDADRAAAGTLKKIAYMIAFLLIVNVLRAIACR